MLSTHDYCHEAMRSALCRSLFVAFDAKTVVYRQYHQPLCGRRSWWSPHGLPRQRCSCHEPFYDSQTTCAKGSRSSPACERAECSNGPAMGLDVLKVLLLEEPLIASLVMESTQKSLNQFLIPATLAVSTVANKSLASTARRVLGWY